MNSEFNIEKVPYNSDTLKEDIDLLKLVIEEHPEECNLIIEEYLDDPSYVEYRLLQLAKEYYE